MKKIFIFFCLTILLLQLFNIVYRQRALFFQEYDVTYWKDRFEHSQWVLPLSKRIIGDDGLYAYIGYGLVNGEGIAGFNSEMPPLGKYFIGLSIKFFNNPLYYSIFFTLGSLMLFYAIGIRVLKDKINSLFTVCLLFLDPLFFSQFWQSMLDISQLFFLLLNVLCASLLLDKKTNNKTIVILPILCGATLGFFAQVKYPVFLFLILIIESVFFISKRTRKEFFLYIISVGLAVLVSNIKFFLDGNSIIDFLKFQKYGLSFYLKSQLTVHKDAIWQILFFGKFPLISAGKELSRVGEWWAMWPVITVIGLSASILFILKKEISFIWKGFGLFLLGSFFILTIIPSYPRYLVVILPFLYLVAIKFIQPFLNKKILILCLVVLLYGIINSFFFLFPKPEIFLNNFYYNFSRFYFQDIYQENIFDNRALKLTRIQFRYIVGKAFDNAKIKAIDIKELEKNIPMFSAKGNIKIRLTYKTQDLGSFYEEKIIKLIQEDGKWKIKWDWDLVFNGFSPDFVVQTEIELGKRGSIINPKGEILAQDSESYLILVDPEKIDLKRESEMLDFISLIGDVKAPHLQNAYLENSLPGTYTPLVSLFSPLDQKIKTKLLSFPGVKLVSYPSRLYKGISKSSIANTFYYECCTKVYSSYNYHGIDGAEKNYDSVLWGHSGGKILIKDKKGAIIRVMFVRDKRDGRDISIN